jgi:hypothetical protein
MHEFVRFWAAMSVWSAVATAAAEPVLFDNGPFITATGVGFGGADVSQTESGTTLFVGVNALGSDAAGGAVRIADDLTLAGGGVRGHRLSRLTWYGFEPTSTGSTANPFTLAYVAIYDGSPLAGGQLLAGDCSTNRFVSGEWTGAFRVPSGSTSIGLNAWPIMAITIDMSWAPRLADGRYYLAVSLGDERAPTAGVFSSPVTPRRATDNADRYVSGAWVASTFDFPFVLFGACPGDFNGAGGVTVQDIFDFLAAYFTGASEADVNADGSVSVQDIFDFLADYFRACP